MPTKIIAFVHTITIPAVKDRNQIQWAPDATQFFVQVLRNAQTIRGNVQKSIETTQNKFPMIINIFLSTILTIKAKMRIWAKS